MTAEDKNASLKAVAEGLLRDKAAVLAANARDVERAERDVYKRQTQWGVFSGKYRILANMPGVLIPPYARPLYRLFLFPMQV